MASQSTSLNSSLQFVVNGQAYTTEQLIRMTPKQKRVTRSLKDSSYHKGFRVEGHPPGSVEAAKIEADNALALFVEDQKAGRASGKPPKSWDESYWRNNHKKKPVRSKPYELRDSADVCAGLARKTGWLDVVVVELAHEAA